jgi:hypothetical protein|nr:MAG TPA: hypothetical protein [Caudoviricetes sp.]
MRTKNKITREQESKVLYFAQDPQVSSRILAVLHVGATKSAVPLYEKKQGTKDIFVYNKKTKKKEKKTITTSIHVFNGQAIKEIERFKVICGSNGKMGTWYNTISGVRDSRAGVEVSEAQKFCRTRVGRNCIRSNVMHLKKSSKQNIITLLKSKKYGLD